MAEPASVTPITAQLARELVEEQFARERAQYERERFHQILNAAPAMIAVLLGPTQVFEFANKRFSDGVGGRPLVGRPIREALPASSHEMLNRLDEVYATGQRRSGEAVETPIDADGDGVAESTTYFDFIYEPLRDRAGHVEGVIIHAVDVTEQVAARSRERDQARLAELAADIGAALTATDEKPELLRRCAQAVVDRLDAAFARIWTLDPVDGLLHLQASCGQYTHLNGAHSRVQVGQFKIGRIAERRKPHLTNDVVNDLEIADPEWARREGLVSFAGYPLLIGTELVGVLAMFARHRLTTADFEGMSSVAHGISVGISRLRAIRALRASETRYRERAEELARTAAALQRTNAELDAFAYAASHDLRAPLRGIANLAQWIEEDLQDTLTDDSREMLALMRSRMHRMESLIDGILQYSRAGRTHEPESVVNVGELVADVADLLSPEAATIVISPDLPTIRAERLPLQQVFQNLISNAIKHGGDGVTVEISARDAGDCMEFRVADDGPGIAPEFHERIWRIFQTLQPRDEVEGAGIGLSLVKKLTEAQGGRVSVESSEGTGATFSVWWPKVREEATA